MITWYVYTVLLLLVGFVKVEENSAPIDPEKTIYYDFLKRFGTRIKEIRNHETFKKDIKYSKPLIVNIYYSKQQCTHCEQREEVIEEVIDRFRGMVEFNKYDCDQEFVPDFDELNFAHVRECFDNPRDRMPVFYFRVPEEGVYYPYNVLSFREPVVEPDITNPDSLAQTIVSYMPVYAMRIKNIQDANTFVEKFGALNKTLYFATDNEIPTYFKALSTIYKDKLEFAFVEPDAYEVIEYFNVTSRPKWVVVRLTNPVYMTTRKYTGNLTFASLKDYLHLFAAENETDRTQNKGMGTTPMRDNLLNQGLSKLRAKEFDFDNYKNNFEDPNEIVIVHITDAFAMNYPNLIVFQNFYGSIATIRDASINTIPRKRVFKKRFPNEHKPFICLYPPGDYNYKVKNRVCMGAHHTLENLIESVSDMIPDTIQSIKAEELENRIVKSLFERKLAV